MSVRAYKIIRKELEDNPSFNLWHDEKLVDYLAENTDFYGLLNDEGTGTTELEVAEIKKIIKQSKQLELDKETVEQLKKDIEGLNDNDWIEYECF